MLLWPSETSLFRLVLLSALFHMSCMHGPVGCTHTFLRVSLINASDRSTINILHQPPLTGIMMKETCASTMSPIRNTCGLLRL